MPVIYQAAAYYFPRNVAHALWRDEHLTHSSSGKQHCVSRVLILLCSSFQLQKKKSESLTTSNTGKWDEKVFEQNISPKVILVLRNAVFAKQMWWPCQNPTERTVYTERWQAWMPCLPLWVPCLQPAARLHRRCHRWAPRAPLTPACPPQPPQQDFLCGHCTGCSMAQIFSRFVFLVTTLTAVCRDKAEFS